MTTTQDNMNALTAKGKTLSTLADWDVKPEEHEDEGWLPCVVQKMIVAFGILPEHFWEDYAFDFTGHIKGNGLWNIKMRALHKPTDANCFANFETYGHYDFGVIEHFGWEAFPVSFKHLLGLPVK